MSSNRYTLISTALATAICASTATVASAQTQPSGPMFSTPASRSTTGAPILSDPTAGNGTIIDSAGGGRSGPAKQPAAPAAQAAPKPEVRKEQAPNAFGDWSLECETGAKSEKLCQVSGRTLSPDGKQVILVASLAPSADGKSVLMQMAVPLGIAVQEQVMVGFEGGHQTSFKVNRCTQQGCLVEDAVDAAFLDAMKKKSKAEITVGTPDGKQIPILLSLRGFSDAYAALASSQAMQN